MPAEIWKEIPGFSKYQASNTGFIRRKIGNSNGGDLSVLPGSQYFDGYIYVHIRNDFGEHKCFKVHRLVCLAFYGLDEERNEVAHCNGVRTDNRAENLRWATAVENQSDREQHGTHNKGSRNGRAKLTEKDVRKIRSRRERGEKCIDIAKDYPVSPPIISAICRRRLWAHV